MQERLAALERELQTQKGQMRNTQAESYQQSVFFSLSHAHERLLPALKTLRTPKTQMVTHLLQQLHTYPNPILAYCADLPHCHATLSHRHHFSQAALVALYFALTNKQVKLISQTYSLLGVSHMLSSEKELDKVTYVRESLEREGVELVDLASWQRLQLSGEVVVIDLFHLNPTEYLPFILTHLAEINKFQQIILYHSDIQDQQIETLSLQLWLNPPTPLQVWPNHPFCTSTYTNDTALLDKLISTLQDESIHPDKHNLALFYPPSTPLPKFTARLRELLAKHQLRSQIALLTTRSALLQPHKNNIFVVSSVKELDSWNADLSNLVYVFDFGEESHFRWDYAVGCFVEGVRETGMREKARRMGKVGAGRVGCYYSLKGVSRKLEHYSQTVSELSSFVVKMIAMSCSLANEEKIPRIAQCIQYLVSIGVLKKQKEKYSVVDERIVSYAQEGISPLTFKVLMAIQDDSRLNSCEQQKYLNLAIMAEVILSLDQHLLAHRESEGSHVKPHPIWRKSGYLESSLDILTKCELIERRKTSNSKSQTIRSRASMSRRSKGGQLDHNERSKPFELMEISDLVKECLLNEQVLYAAREGVEAIREVLQLSPLPMLLQKQDVSTVVQYLMLTREKAIGQSWGRKSEHYETSTSNLTVSKNCFFRSGGLPQIAILLRIQEIGSNFEVTLANSISADTYQSYFSIPPPSKKQVHQPILAPTLQKTTQITSETTSIVFPALPILIINEFLINDGILTDYFEEEHHCSLDINEDSGTIVLHCDPDSNCQQSFRDLLKELKETIHEQTVTQPYLGNVAIVLKEGGIAVDIIRTVSVPKCMVENIPAAASLEDLRTFFTGFRISKIEMDERPGEKRVCFVKFITPQQYPRFYQKYHKSLFWGLTLIVSPFKGDEQVQVQRTDIFYIEFQWFVWKSHCKGLVIFSTEEEAEAAGTALKNNPNIDGVEVTSSVSGRQVTLENLSPMTDELHIQEALREYGRIQEVELLKTPMKEVSGEERHLEYLIKNTETGKNTEDYKIKPIAKGQQGRRICKVHFHSSLKADSIAAEMDGCVAKLGEGKLHARSWYEIPTLVPDNSMSIYQELLQETLQQFPHRPNILPLVEHDSDKTYLILRGSKINEGRIVHQLWMDLLKGTPLQLGEEVKKVVLSEGGMDNFADLEEKYSCKLILDQQNQVLSVVAPQKLQPRIKQQLMSRIEGNFYLSLPISRHLYKLYTSQPELLENIRIDRHLRALQLEEDIQAVIMEGSARRIQTAVEVFAPVIAEKKPKVVETDVELCHICYDPIQAPFRLCCGHGYCSDCLSQYLQYALRDSSCYPLKCPSHECRKLIPAPEMDRLLLGQDWGRVNTFATNQLVFQRTDLTFCDSPACGQICKLHSYHAKGKWLQYYSCPLCGNNRCLSCKTKYHPGYSCDEQRNDLLFKQYMKENDVRECVNKRCKVPVVRWTGCYKVHCSRCGINMCFKCPANAMEAYSDQNLCYRHLATVHGGFF